MRHLMAFAVLLSGLTFGFATPAVHAGFYNDEPALFTMRPDPKKSTNPIARFGPVGLSLDLIKPNLTIKIAGVEPGSPAAKTGELKPGMIIHTINGEKLADIDPRIQLGNMITKAEAGDGKMVMVVSDKLDGPTREVVVQLEPMGAFSETWPLNCPKSDKIVRNLAEYIKGGGDQGFGSLGMLFLLATEDESDLEHVRKWAHSRPDRISGNFHTWNAGYGNLALCEYYLRTGDEKVLPKIQAVTDFILQAENNGGWGNRGAISGLDYGGGGGHLNASGVHAATFIVLAKLCGAEIPDKQFNRILAHFYRFAGRGNVPYGNNLPEGSYTDNGKNGGLAFTMAAASRLTPDGEESVYAGARDHNALFSFNSTSYMNHGHTGGGIGEVWRSAAMGLLYDKQPELYRDFMNQRRWHYEMSRRHNGSFGILGGERYDKESWGTGYALTFIIPRKTLQITGAPLSPHAKVTRLPERPWGTAEDDDFATMEAIAYSDGSRPDFSKETLASGGGMALLAKGKQDLTSEELERYIRHPLFITRGYFNRKIAEQGPAYILKLLNDPDARMRRLALDTVTPSRGTTGLATPEIIERATEIVADPNESWFVKEAAIRTVGLAEPDVLVEKVDLLIPYLQHDEWWLQHAALNALAPVAVDKRVYKKVLPALGELLASNHLFNMTSQFRWGQLPTLLKNADPEVAKFAGEVFKDAYVEYEPYEHPLDTVAGRINPGMKTEIAKAMTKLPGGYDLLYEVAKQARPGKTLPYEELFLAADSSKFSPELKAQIDKITRNRLIPRYIANNRSYLLRERENEAIPGGFYYREARVFGLRDLYRNLGEMSYEWHDVGPDPTDMSWYYLNFDPTIKKEQMAWDVEKTRYRPVTVPEGNEGWYQPSFDPAAKGWKQGKQPFGSANGKLVNDRGSCPYHEFCRHDVEPVTLWDKEVMLMRGKFKFPEFKEGRRYRLLVGGMSHVGAGEGFKIWVNGKEFFERNRGVGKREGAKPISKHIDKSWWKEFSGKEVDIAHLSFMNLRKGTKRRQVMIWVQEMKLPPLDDEVMNEAVQRQPLRSAEWQKSLDPDDPEASMAEAMYVWNGDVEPNPGVEGSWQAVARVEAIEGFDASARPNTRGVQMTAITINSDGSTHDPMMIWSGSKLLNLKKNEALTMTVKTIGGEQYLFIEEGGFKQERGPEWTSPLIVFKKNQ